MSVNSWYLWLAIGLLGQACFFARFLFQWLESERQGQSVIPESFWWFSVAGCGLLLSYAIYRQDIVFILGQTFGGFVYLRNLHLIRRKKT